MSSLDCGGGSSFELSFAYLCEPLCRLFSISNIAGEVISFAVRELLFADCFYDSRSNKSWHIVEKEKERVDDL